MSSIFRILKSSVAQIIESVEPVSKTQTKTKTKSKPKSKPGAEKKSKVTQLNNPFVLPSTKSSSTKSKSQVKEPSKSVSTKPTVIQTQESSAMVATSDPNPVPNQLINPVVNPKIEDKQSPDTNTLNSQIYWEYGNSGLKTKKLGKLMGKNLAILYYIDKVFACYNDLPNNSLSELFTSQTKREHKFGDSVISNELTDGQPNVQIKLDLGVAKGTYKIESVGFTTISNIKIQEKDLTKYRVPSFDNFISRLDNFKELHKITNILNITRRFEYTTNTSSPEFSLENIMTNYNYVLELFRQENTERKLLRSSRDYAFYIKIYEKYNKAFVIDGLTKLIYYIVSNEDLDNGTIFIRYYSIKITDDYKIKSIQV